MIKRIAFTAFTLALLLWTASPLTAQNKGLMSPTADGQKRECLDCHRRPNINTNEGVFASQTLCLECHGQEACVRKAGPVQVSLKVPVDSLDKSGHKYAACIHCHTDVAGLPHQSQSGAQCRQCHSVHHTNGDPHLRVDCQACHRGSGFVRLDRQTGRVSLARVNDKDQPVALTDHVLADTGDPALCQRCHASGNKVGASAWTPPAKSLICLVCHDAPLTLGHWIFWLAALVFVFGLFINVQLWFRGKVGTEYDSTHRKLALGAETWWNTFFSREMVAIIKTFVLDVLLQRRLLKESVKRWAIHSLIYLPILIRFSLSVVTVLTYYLFRDGSWSLTLIDKNAPFTAAIDDLLGLMILTGVAWAAAQRFVIKPKHTLSELQDTAALFIIGLLVLAGFVLEGARILMTQIPIDMAAGSFVGFFFANLLSVLPINWTGAFPVLWSIHAILGAVLIAWLPYGKMRHILITPLSLILSRKLK